MKNGSSHLDFVLSFAIFILFVVFMYSIIQPAIETPSGKESLLKLLRFDLLDRAQAEDFTVMTIDYTGGTPAHNCIKFSLVSTKLNGIITEEKKGNLIIRNENNNMLNYRIEGGGSELKIFGIDSTQDALLKIYYSEILESSESGSGGCRNVNDEDFIIGAIKEESQKILSSKISDLLNDYNTDCGANLKNQIGFPSDSDFTFSFLLADGITRIEPTCAEIPNTNVYAEEFPVQYLNDDLNLQVGKMTVKVW